MVEEFDGKVRWETGGSVRVDKGSRVYMKWNFDKEEFYSVLKGLVSG